MQSGGLFSMLTMMSGKATAVAAEICVICDMGKKV